MFKVFEVLGNDISLHTISTGRGGLQFSILISQGDSDSINLGFDHIGKFFGFKNSS